MSDVVETRETAIEPSAALTPGAANLTPDDLDDDHDSILGLNGIDIDVETLEYLTPDEYARFIELVAELRAVENGTKRRPLTLKQFVDRLSHGKYVWYRYARVLGRVLQSVADGRRKRVMIFAPPRHGKSELVSRYFPAYYLYRHPEQWVGLCSYGSELATSLSRVARDHYWTNVGVRSTGAVKHWHTGRNGGMWSAGVGGPITGKGFHLGIIDDPVKNAEDAASERIRARHKDWYQSTFYTRAEPDAAIVLIQTRWHEDDLAGWLLQQERDAESEGQTCERWHIVNFAAVREDPEELKRFEAQIGYPLFPNTCSVEPDWRETGEALCEERYSTTRLKIVETRIGEYYFNALFQQRPRARDGAMFKADGLPVVADFKREGCRFIRWWDYAASDEKKGGTAYTVGALVARSPEGVYTLIDIVRGQWNPTKRDQEIRATAQSDKLTFGFALIATWREQEPGSSGVDSAQAFVRLLAGYTAKFEPSSGSKTERADPLAVQSGAGNFQMLKASWNAVARREFIEFPFGKTKDIVDATSAAFNKLSTQLGDWTTVRTAL